MEKACFYGAGLFLRRRPISTEQAYFYGAGLFLRRRSVSTEQACFYGEGLFLRSRPVSTEQAYISTKSVRVSKNEKACALWATVVNHFYATQKTKPTSAH